jgi:hypothetical protein
MDNYELKWQGKTDRSLSEMFSAYCESIPDRLRGLATELFGDDAAKLEISLKESPDGEFRLSIDGPDEMVRRLRESLNQSATESEV